jgi:hypothetical protein
MGEYMMEFLILDNKEIFSSSRCDVEEAKKEQETAGNHAVL